MSQAKATSAQSSDGKTAVSSAPKKEYISLLALTMMNVTMIAGIGNDVQQAFYGLSSVTFFAIGALVFFIPTGLVAAELASGWGQRGGSFRWIGEGLGEAPAFLSLFILWFQTTIMFGSGMPTAAATIGFYTPNLEWAIHFAEHPSHTLIIVLCWMAFYWFLAFLSTKGVKAFSKLAQYGVLIGSIIPLAVMVILSIVWLMQGNRPNIEFTAEGLIPKWEGLPTLAMAAGVFFSYAGIEMNAAHIKQLEDPKNEYPKAIFLSMIICFLIFVVGTLIIATIIPEGKINLLYTLAQTFAELGATIGMPWLYMVFTWAGLFNLVANLVTNMAGPSFMLGQVARAGFLPPKLQSNNAHGMPSRLIYFQMFFASLIALIFLLIPNIEGFVILITQAVTILYMFYYILMFVAYIKLKYDQPYRPRSFTVPGGMFGAWFVTVVGVASCVFGIVLALVPPAQLLDQIGSPITYVAIVGCLDAFVIFLALVIYKISRKHNWVDPSNEFAPFTWQIEGLKKPQKVLSNISSDDMTAGQDPMGLPIVRPYGPNDTTKDIIEYVKSRGGTDSDIEDALHPKHTPAPPRSKNAGPAPDPSINHIALGAPVSALHSPLIHIPDSHPYYTLEEIQQMKTVKKWLTEAEAEEDQQIAYATQNQIKTPDTQSTSSEQASQQTQQVSPQPSDKASQSSDNAADSQATSQKTSTQSSAPDQTKTDGSSCDTSSK